MRRLLLLLAATATLAACRTSAERRPTLAPLRDEGEVFVYLEPAARDRARPDVTLASITAVSADGAEVPLALARPAGTGGGASGRVPWQQLLASGRLPPGSYSALL